MPADIVISEFMDLPAVERLRERHDVLYDPELVDRPEELSRHVADARALIVRNRTQVRGALLQAAGRLVSIGRLGVGLDNIDVDACAARGIGVHPATGANDLSVAEYVVTGALLLLREAYGATSEVADGKWPRQRMIGREAAGKTLGLVGFGAIARAAAERAAALGMRVLAYDPFVGADDPAWSRHGAAWVPTLGALLGRSDVVSLHVPLLPATRHLIDEGAIGRMKPGAVLINAARGGVVDEDALARALGSGRLAAALLDVFESEPLAANNPFRGLPNVVLTPHIAGVTVESNERVSAVVADAILRALDAASGTGR